MLKEIETLTEDFGDKNNNGGNKKNFKPRNNQKNKVEKKAEEKSDS